MYILNQKDIIKLIKSLLKVKYHSYYRMVYMSFSPWGAQAVVVKGHTKSNKRRLCTDYSQTVNLYTELDGYPLPRIDGMKSSLAKYMQLEQFTICLKCI